MSYKLTLDIPFNAFSVLSQNPTEFGKELLEAALCKWYELGRISQSKAAEIANISRYEFIEVMKKHNVSPFQYTLEELDKEFIL
ncbi:MAG: UPF0175 family protein [Bacteroidales bacterium]|nr:UPF0175 family protein [Bacteroidales bacterium]MCF8455747.1 UPF0175 family protein [Bacteroidales bacterium]